MKRFALLILAIVPFMKGKAQSTGDIQYFDVNGNEMVDGGVYTSSEVKTDETTGDVYIPFTLTVKYLKNDTVDIESKYTYDVLPSGSMKIDRGDGLYNLKTDQMTRDYYTKDGTSYVQVLKWFPANKESYGTTSITLKSEAWTYWQQSNEEQGLYVTFLEDRVSIGPTCTLKLVYSDPTGIATIQNDTSKRVIAYYNLSGQPVTADTKGMIIEKLSDGTARKVLRR